MADAHIWIDFFHSLCWLLFQKVVYNSPEAKRRASILSVLTSFITQHLGYCRLYLNPFSFSETPPMAGNKKLQVGQPPWDGLALPSPYLSTREASLKEMQPKSVTQTQGDLISCWQNFLSSFSASCTHIPSFQWYDDWWHSFLPCSNVTKPHVAQNLCIWDSQQLPLQIHVHVASLHSERHQRSAGSLSPLITHPIPVLKKQDVRNGGLVHLFQSGEWLQPAPFLLAVPGQS